MKRELWHGSKRVIAVSLIAGSLLIVAPSAVAVPTREDRCPVAIPAPPQHPPLPDQPDPLMEVHRFATGNGVRVAVIDTGVANHPRLGGVEAVADLVDPDAANDSAFFDCDGHGTIVAGIIAARRGSDPVVGVAPDARILSIRQTSGLQRKEDNEDGKGTLATVATAIDRAVSARAQVINISVVSCLPASLGNKVDTSQLDAALARAEASGAVVVAAAGNISQQCAADSLVYPAHSPTVLAVSASESSHELAHYSVTPPDAPLSAPGTVHVALSPRDDGLATALRTTSGSSTFTGTSFAAPYVAGTVALLKERYPTESPQQWRNRIIAAQIPGTGHIDAHRALTQVAPVSAKAHPAVVKAPAKSVRRSEHRAQVMLALLVVALTMGTVVVSVWTGMRR